MSARKRPLPSDWALSNPSRPPVALRRSLLDAAYSSSFNSQTALQAHHSCVNGLAVSPDGRWLASGGDDQRVLLWNASDDGGAGQGVAAQPVGCYKGARSNIFTLSFSCDGSKVFSAGNDASIVCHDIDSSSSSFPIPLHEGVPPVDVWLDHDDAVMGLSCHPTNPHLFLSASSDGTIRYFDTRTQPGCVGILADMCSFDDVAYHPITPDVFAFAGENATLGLVDGRMAWSDGARGGARVNGEMQASIVSEVAVMQFDAALSRPLIPDLLQYARPTVSSAVFSPTGSLLSATLSGHLPTLYELSSPAPLATFSSPSHALPPQPDGKDHILSFPTSYRNTCTTKHGSFSHCPGATAGNGLYYAAGSDDFKAYVWEVPDIETLREGRKEVAKEELRDVGYRSRTPGGIYTLPAAITAASTVLTAHRSIVNTALFHPTLPLIYTSGVEKLIVRHSPTSPSSPLRPAPVASTSATTSAPPSSRSSWHFTPRPPRAQQGYPGLLEPGPSDAALDPTPREGESPRQREVRLRAEDLEVLEYFDAIVEREDAETLWDPEGERFGADSSDEDDDEEGLGWLLRSGLMSDGEGDGEGDSEHERAAGEGDEGTTRRILRAIYAREAADGASSDRGAEASSGEEQEQAR